MTRTGRRPNRWVRGPLGRGALAPSTVPPTATRPITLTLRSSSGRFSGISDLNLTRETGSLRRVTSDTEPRNRCVEEGREGGREWVSEWVSEWGSLRRVTSDTDLRNRCVEGRKEGGRVCVWWQVVCVILWLFLWCVAVPVVCGGVSSVLWVWLGVLGVSVLVVCVIL